MSKKLIYLISFVLLLGVLQAVPAEAHLVEFEFGGIVTSVDPGILGCDPPWDQVSVGDPWSIVYTFESTTPDTDGASDHGAYAAITCYTLNVGGNVVHDSGLAGEHISIFSNRPVGWDQYEVRISLPSGYQWFMQLDDDTNTAWNTDELPLCGDIVLSNFGIRNFTLSGFVGFGCEIRGSVDYHRCGYLSPSDGATCVPLDVVLHWSPGCCATSYNVYFGTDPAALVFLGTVVDTSYPPGPLEICTTYYWRINEVCDGDEVPGEVWSFTTWCRYCHIKWSQPPDETPTGMDIRIDRVDGVERTLADDFECITTGPITDVHFWGSWKGDPEPRGYIYRIHLSIHKDIPADSNSYSMPGDLLWERDFDIGEFTETLYADLSPKYEWWWDPYTSPEWADPNGDQKIYRYDIHIDPNVAFIQEGSVDDPVIYWLDIYVLTEFGEFGWKTSKIHWNDDAVYKAMPDVSPPWSELRYPPQHPYTPESIDMAFMIATKPIVELNEACCFPDGTCLELTPAECIEKDGWPQGPGTDCTSTKCPTPEPNEACCLPDGSCADLTLAECLALGGTPQDPGMDCSSVECPIPCEIGEVSCENGEDPVVITYWAGFNDNFASPQEPASPDAILQNFITTCSPLHHIPLQFDQVPGEGGVPSNSWLGHTFSGLPLGIVAARLEIRARATTGWGKGGTYNDHISIVESIAGCTPTWAWQNRFENLPEAGGDWLPGEVATFCLDLAALPKTTGDPCSVLDQLASGSLSIRIDDDTGLDYMKLTIAVCPCEYRYPSEVLAGAGDCNFPMPVEDASPRPELFTAFPPGSWRKFGQIVPDKRFGHTFTELPSEIVAAELEICLRAGRDIPIDDELHLEFLNDPTPTFAWGKTIKDLPLTPGGTPIGSWDEGDIETFTLDLGNLLPSAAGVTSVLGKLEDGNLDVYIQDDTAVGYIILRYWRCCEKTVPSDVNIDGITNLEDVAILANHWLEETAWP